MKNNLEKSRSIRFSQEMEEFIEELDGKNFGDKLKNLINTHMKTLPQLKEDIENMEKVEKSLCKDIEERKRLLYDFENILDKKNQMEELIKKMLRSE